MSELDLEALKRLLQQPWSTDMVALPRMQFEAILAALERAERLEGALREWAGHKYPCRAFFDEEDSCDCGRDEMLDALAPTTAEERRDGD